MLGYGHPWSVIMLICVRSCFSLSFVVHVCFVFLFMFGISASVAIPNPIACGSNSPCCTCHPLLGMAFSFARFPPGWPCVDCGRITGNYCDDCLAKHWMPNDKWSDTAQTPFCTICEEEFLECHYCREVSMCTPPAFSGVSTGTADQKGK